MNTFDLMFVVDLFPLGWIATDILLLKNLFLSSTKKFILIFLLSFFLISWQFISNFLGLYGKNYLIFSPWDNVVTARHLSPLGYHIYSYSKLFFDKDFLVLNNEEKNKLSKWMKENFENFKLDKNYGIFKNKNLILIQLESFEGFVLEKKYKGQEITPILNRMIKDGIYFPNFYEQVNEGMTSDAELMANTSIYPLRQGSTFFRFPNTFYNTLPLIMQSQGYSTAAFMGDNGTIWNTAPVIKEMGFQKIFTVADYIVNESFGMGFAVRTIFKTNSS